MDITDQPNSICHIQSIHMYPLPSTDHQKQLPFGLLTGETVVHSGALVDDLIVVTNYRLYIQIGENQYHIPLGLIETVEIRELFYLQICCKDARTYRCTFENNENALEWYDRILKAAEPPRQLEQLFAFYHCVWSKEKGGEEVAEKLENQKKYSFDKKMFEDEMARLQFQGASWRISKANENYKLCPTYPPYLLVPSCINDEMLECVAKFRSSRRIPAAVWRHTRNGAVIARCSQPEVGWLGWRSGQDEDLIKAISEACNFDRPLRTSDRDSNLSNSPGSLHSDESLQITSEINQQEKKVLIMDARSYTTAVANRARGGGCECPEYYPNCEIQFMNLANIHSIRKSFHALRQLCTSSAEQPNWFSQLEGTRWLLHMSGLMKAAVTLTTAVERDARPVVVHCSDGWDRTPQIVALAEVLLDPYYRTVDGFRVLIEREWLAFGHKFADRCGHSTGSEDINERCPVFLQWLDCIHHLLMQFPCAFEFSQNYLIKLAQHTYSNLFGTFLCNTQKQRSKAVYGKTFSVWEFLSAPCFRNHLYAPIGSSCWKRVLWPQTNVRNLYLWSELYLGSSETNFSPEGGSGACPGPPEAFTYHNMAKTRSYGDLINADVCQNQYRRSSDPSINHDTKLIALSQDGNNRERLNSNGTESGPDFLPSDLEDTVDCNQDCIFKNGNTTTNLTDDQIDGLDQEDFESKPKKDEKLATEDFETNDADEVQLRPKHTTNFLCQGDEIEEDVIENVGKTEICDLESERSSDRQNGNNNNSDSGSEKNTADGDSRSSDVECQVGGRVVGVEKSVETSTETLVLENIVCSSSPKEYNGFEKIQSPIENVVDHTDSCKVCAQSIKIPNGNHQNGYNNDHRSRYSQYSRMSNSSNSWDNTLHNYHHQKKFYPYQHQLGEDGLMPIKSPIQERLNQIIEEERKKVELLEKELHASRQILIRQACHKCTHTDGERQDDNSSRESVCSAGEGNASVGESLRSDLSWVAVEEGILAECQSTLWVPDHAVNRCTGCGTEFWLGRRRHHCRRCGKIFCADCSENSTPLPSEQLYNPVRVCTGCYSELRRDCGGVPNQCKHGNSATTNTNPQIAASSN